MRELEAKAFRTLRCMLAPPEGGTEERHLARRYERGTKKGYIMIRVPEHPRARSNGGWMFEHILVMEEDLGRYLLPEETIHQAIRN